MFLAALSLLTPAVALVVVGVLVLVFSRATVDVTFGVLILSFCVALLVGTLLLVISLKRANDLSHLQLDFLSKVSHEFKTPLTSIRMFAETLSEQPALSADQRDRCHRMLRQETDRLHTMIQRLLDFGRMEAGQMVYHRRPESVERVVQSAVSAFTPMCIREQVRFASDIAPDLPPLSMDQEMMTQALLNLLQNAAKYGGEPRDVRLVCARENGHIALSVHDNGPGIPRRERRRIFERFYRIDDRLSRKQEGSGLGLAIVRHVVQAHGGQVRVRNRPEGGAEFSILLPDS
jgi:two-component system phosphate regulon sensor histidine kinase PhoR